MMTYSELDHKWISFLKDFFGNRLILKDLGEFHRVCEFNIEQLFETDMSLKRKYGFLSLHFTSTIEFDRFLEIQGFILNREDKMTDYAINPITFYTWIDVKEVFPSRVYPARKEGYQKYISFYDKKNITEIEIIMENRIRTIQLILQVVIQLKIENCTKI